MTIRWGGCAVFLMLCLSLPAFATSPQIGVLDPSCTASSGYTNVYSTSQSLDITPNANGGGIFTFCNLTGESWSSVTFTAQDVFGFSNQTWIYGYPLNPNPAYITCSPGTASDRPYSACVVQINQQDTTAGSDGTIFMTFFNGSSPPDGVHNGYSMTVTLNTNFCVSDCGDNSGGWLHNGQPVPLTGTTTSPVPEPNSLLLLLSGVAAIGILVRTRH